MRSPAFTLNALVCPPKWHQHSRAASMQTVLKFPTHSAMQAVVCGLEIVLAAALVACCAAARGALMQQLPSSRRRPQQLPLLPGSMARHGTTPMALHPLAMTPVPVLQRSGSPAAARCSAWSCSAVPTG